MPATVTLSVKNVPTRVAKRLKERAARNNRSLQGELQSILEEASYSTTIGELAAFVARLALSTPSESARMIREDRDDPRR
jgi:plasmid stability protein